MADDMKFSHITVTTDDEDDVVIQAGAKSPASVVPDRAAIEGAAEDAAAVAAKVASASVSDQSTTAGAPAVAATATGASQTAAQIAAASEHASRGAKPSGASKDTYHATTLEDIESTKMPLAQKVVIALAVLGVAGFAVWYALA